VNLRPFAALFNYNLLIYIDRVGSEFWKQVEGIGGDEGIRYIPLIYPFSLSSITQNLVSSKEVCI